MSVGKSSIKRVAAPTAEVKTAPEAPAKDLVEAKPAAKKAPAKKPAAKTAPKAAPRHPANDSTTSKFANLNLQFGRNYDPTHR